MRRLILRTLLLLLVPLWAHAANPDLAISANDIRFSKETLVAGQSVRLYARIQNVGDEDMSGYVTFFQGNAILGNSQVISLLANGVPEEVYIDFIVPAGTFNIRAELKGSEPQDVNPANDIAITGMIEPVQDGDGDGVADGKDNCPQLSNPTQADADQDGLGDACDSDDDNDGLSDEVEAELGTNQTKKDTDEDKVEDADDAYPSDATKQKIDPAPPVKKAFEQIVGQVAKSIQTEQKEVTVTPISTETSDAQPDVVVETLTFSPHAVFSYSHDRWNTYTFRVSSALEDQHYEWDFGDGVRSNKIEVTHVYDRSGAYPVSLTVQDAQGRTSVEKATVFVPFFSLENRMVVVMIILLIVLLTASGWALWVNKKQQGAHV